VEAEAYPFVAYVLVGTVKAALANDMGIGKSIDSSFLHSNPNLCDIRVLENFGTD